MRENFIILKQRAALERPTFPGNYLAKSDANTNLLLFRVPEPCLGAILDCRMTHGMAWIHQETFLNDHLLEKDEHLLCSTIQRNWHPLLKNWDLTFLEIQSNLQWNETRTAEFVNTCTTLPKREGLECTNILVGLHSGVVDYPRFPISELHLGNFLDSMEFQSWKVNFKTEVCSETADLHLTMQWIKEVETAKFIDDLMTLRSITGRSDSPDYDMLDATIASALKRLLDKHVHFRKE